MKFRLILFLAAASSVEAAAPWGLSHATRTLVCRFRGGQAEADTAEMSLDEKVQAAMKKLGITPPGSSVSTVPPRTEDNHDSVVETVANNNNECKDGVCPVSESKTEEEPAGGAPEVDVNPSTEEENKQEDTNVIADRIASDMAVDRGLVMAAIGATLTDSDKVNEEAARGLIQQELDIISQLPEDNAELQQLVSEGYDKFYCRRALAFAEGNIDDARAILLADKEDEEQEEAERKAREEKQRMEEEEEQKRAQLREEAKAKKETMKTVTVPANFDPTAPVNTAGATVPPAATSPQLPQGAPPPAKKEDVIFEATSENVQELVIESPVPVLLDVYADWCGPCKALTPALEEMAIKGGGMFRLVKINSDNERAIASTALEVTSLPTVFGIRDGKILNKFEGMPRNEKFMQNFMMGLLMPGGTFDPPVTASQQQKLNELTSKMAKAAGAAAFSFSARERLQDRVSAKLDELVDSVNGDLVDADQSATVLRSLLSHAIKDPMNAKFRRINLENKVVAEKVACYPACVAILKSVGFVPDGGSALVLGKGKKVVNVAPLTVARAAIDKWIDKSRYLVAAATRRRKDEEERTRLALEEDDDEYDEEYDEEEEEIDPNECKLQVRVEGKNKVQTLTVTGDHTLKDVLAEIPAAAQEGEMQITCAAKRLVIKSTDDSAMGKSLKEHGLFPSASLVIRQGGTTNGAGGSSLSKRAAQKAKKTGSHTMQSVGIYGKDDHLKGELVDGGGGTLWEQDVTDDEDEPPGDGDEEGALEDEKEDEKQEEAGTNEESEVEEGSEEEEN